jgi:hypothetical protein
MTWVMDITEKANQITGLDISPFTTVFSPEVGTVVWSMAVPDLAALEAANDKLIADDGYVVLIDEGSRLVQSNVDDGLLQIIHGEVNRDRRIEYASSVQAVCATGNVAHGLELGVEIAQRAEQATGIPTMFASSMNGPYGAITWVSGFSDIHEMDRAQQALAADTDFVRFIDDKAPGVYVEDFAITRQTTYRRIV